MKKFLFGVSLLIAGFAPPLRAESERFYAFWSEYIQAMHLGHWATVMDVNGRRPVVDLVLALDAQRQKINDARKILLPHRTEPIPEARRAVQGLLNGLEMYSLCNASDLEAVNGMNDRWELAQRLDGNRDERREAVDVMAASALLLRQSLYERAVPTDRRRKPFLRPRFSPEEAASLWKQLTLLFGEDLAKGGAATSPMLASVEELRKSLRDISRNGKKSP
jgi:hypothetical protein